MTKRNLFAEIRAAFDAWLDQPTMEADTDITSFERDLEHGSARIANLHLRLDIL